MIRGKRVLGLIPARGGSKAVPRKNLRPLLDKPLVAWTIEEARRSTYIDRLILSSDDQEVIAVAKACGCETPFVRPAELARDESPTIQAVLHALRTMPERYDYVVLLQPTSPLRTAQDIDGCIELCLSSDSDACVSLVEADGHPYWMYSFADGKRIKPLFPEKAAISRRQDLPPLYSLNGAVYVAKVESLQSAESFIGAKTVGYVMPAERSIDIDREADLLMVERILQKEHCPP